MDNINCKDCIHYTNWNCAPGGYCEEIVARNYVDAYCSDSDYEPESMDVAEDFGCKFFERKKNGDTNKGTGS